ncbi:MAG TPA: UDP-N-acetylglucosamine 2-epimerase, partial [Candidatus Wallbacteria bacterium]|nr:UDP-N-acetylglucosamine 2-epimerase [Candidatus Wallbacteria bacterium]
MKKPFKIISVFGTRPDAIKMAPLVTGLAAMAAGSGGSVVTKTAVTAQHREMLDQALEIFQIKPDFDFNLMSGNQGLEELTVRIINSAAGIFSSEKPDLVLVHGDTTTAMAVS